MINSKKIQGVILDFDGTLVDSEPLHFQANSKAFFETGHKIDQKEYYLHWSILGESAQGEIKRYNLKNIDIDSVKKRAKELFGNLILSTPVPPMPGAEKFLTDLQSKKIPMIIASNSTPDQINIMLESSGLKQYKIPVIGNITSLRRKPHPDIFLAALKQLEMDPLDCLVVEDTIKGLKASISAKIPCIIVRSFRYPQIDFPGATKIVDNLLEISTML